MSIPKPKQIVDEIESSLLTIQSGNQVTVANNLYTFVNSIDSSRIHRGFSLIDARDLELSQFPAISITGIQSKNQTQEVFSPETRFNLQILIEAADELNGRNPIDVGLDLIYDIQHAVKLKLIQINSFPLMPVSYKIKEPFPGEDLVLIRYEYNVSIVEAFP